jgi:hypothetical protein
MYKVLGAESYSGGETQLAAANQNPHQKNPCVLLQQVLYIQW